MTYEKTTIKSTGLSKKYWNELKRNAIGSLYRMNARTADCYAFTPLDNGDYQGGWDWSNSIVDQSANFILMLENKSGLKQGKVYRIK